ncbi:MAG: putative transcriptional regulator [Candidatus Nitrosomirales archaeon]|jgi:predicted transcriptional regulator
MTRAHARDRKDLVTATTIILQTLRSGEPFSLNKLTTETGLNFRTVKKSLEFLETIGSLLNERKIDVLHADRLTLVQMKEKTGLASLPEHVQHLIIKTAYYPTVSREEEILAYLLLHNAVDPRSAISIQKDVTLEKLVEAEHIEEKRAKYYLTSIGKMVAQGALKLYPELKTVTERMRIPA